MAYVIFFLGTVLVWNIPSTLKSPLCSFPISIIPTGNSYPDPYQQSFIWPVLGLHVNGIIQNVLFSIRLFSFNIRSVKSVHGHFNHVEMVCYFLLFCSVLCYEQATLYFTHSIADEHWCFPRVGLLLMKLLLISYNDFVCVLGVHKHTLLLGQTQDRNSWVMEWMHALLQ